MKTCNIFLGADLRLGHLGLIKLAETKAIKLLELKEGEAVIFINAKRNRMKSYAWNSVVSYVRSEETNRPIDLNALDYLAQTFNPKGQMDYSAALKNSLEKRLNIKGKLEPECLKPQSKVIVRKKGNI